MREKKKACVDYMTVIKWKCIEMYAMGMKLADV